MRKMKLFSAILCTSMVLAGCASAPTSASMTSVAEEKVISDDAIRASQFIIESTVKNVEKDDNPLDLIAISDQNGQRLELEANDNGCLIYESEYYNLDIIYSVVSDEDNTVRIRYTLQATDYTSEPDLITQVAKTFTFEGTLDEAEEKEKTVTVKAQKEADSSEDKKESGNTESSTKKSGSKSSIANNNSSSSSGTTAGNGVSNNSQSNTTKSITESAHVHNWQAHTATRTVHHDATGHYETVVTGQTWVQDSAAYDEQVSTPVVECRCGQQFGTYNEWLAHSDSAIAATGDWSAHGGHHSAIAYSTVHHEATGHYENTTSQQWVEDSAAYDTQETYTDYYVCTTCGATK